MHSPAQPDIPSPKAYASVSVAMHLISIDTDTTSKVFPERVLTKRSNWTFDFNCCENQERCFFRAFVPIPSKDLQASAAMNANVSNSRSQSDRSLVGVWQGLISEGG